MWILIQIKSRLRCLHRNWISLIRILTWIKGLVLEGRYHLGARSLSVVQSREVSASRRFQMYYYTCIGRAIGGIGFVRCTDVVCFSESPLFNLEFSLYT